MSDFSIKEIKAALKETKATWVIDPKLKDADEVPLHTLGANIEGLPSLDEVGPVPFQEILKEPASNPWLLQRHIDLGVLARPQQLGRTPNRPSLSLVPDIQALPEAGAASSVDWRNRWGWPWITSIRDQDGCQACWVFTAVATVEAMTRIEHCIWPRLSEGDVHDGIGALCPTTGSIEGALDWITANGVCDPDCFPWTPQDIPYTPCADRSGRSVRIPKYTHIGSVADQKKWLDTVGPLGAYMAIYRDFNTYGGGIYSPLPGQKASGLHAITVVGYDDTQGCWIIKNSWGRSWGEAGFCRLAYGQCGIDTYPMVGVKLTNPDPWTKRRYHNGNLLETRSGTTYRNFLMLFPDNKHNRILQYWRDNDYDNVWRTTSNPSFARDVRNTPAIIESTEETLECVFQTNSSRLHHWWAEYADTAQQFNWYEGPVFGPDDVAGEPCLIQSNYGHPGTLEVVVRTADSRLSHWWRDLDKTWQEGPRFGSNVASGPTLVQSHYGTQGNFELVCVLKNGQMQHWWRNNDTDKSWNAGPSFGSNVHSSPCMIEGSAWALDETQAGCLELCVEVNNQVQHWWRSTADMKWYYGATFGHDIGRVCGLLESSFGFCLELIVCRKDGRPQHYWRDGAGWHEGPIIA